MELTFKYFIIIIVVWSFYCNGIVYSQKPLLPNNSDTAKSCRKPVVEILVSPVVTKTMIRELIIAWDVRNHLSKGDWIGLYDSPPDINKTRLCEIRLTDPRGQIRTGISEDRKFPENPDFDKRCLGFWVAYWKASSSNPAAVSCLGTNPTWMYDYKEEIKHLKLKEMFLPGTHDTGAFYLAYSPFTETRYHKYVFAQDENILEQMIHGARYLDFRIGQYKGKWWLNHGPVKVYPLEYGLDEVKMFLNNTKEIIVLDFHNFPVGFKKKETHTKFVNYLREQLGDYAAPPYLTWDVQLHKLWDMDKRLIISYNDKRIVPRHLNLLWRSVSQKWADANNINDLHDYFNGVFLRAKKTKSMTAWAAMVQLTPTVWDIVRDKSGGLRKTANKMNPLVNRWFRGEWGSICNAVAVDFLRSSAIVDIAIKWNYRKGKKTDCDPP